MPAALPLTAGQINAIKILRTHGLSYRKIAEGLSISLGSAHKYGTEVIVLPPKLQGDPWAELQRFQNNPLSRVNTRSEFKDRFQEKEYWIQQHVEGKPFEGPVDLVSLDELVEMMQEPTNYISPLNQTDFYNYYIAPMMFRGENPQLSNSQIIINHMLDSNPMVMVKVFRGVGKTVLVEGRLVRIICENRENNYAVQSEAIERSEERLQVVRNHLMGNKRIIAHFGYLPLDKSYKNIQGKWKKDEITVKRDTIQTDPTLKAVSWKDSRLLGGHFMGVLFDDPWSSKLEENSEKNKQKWFRWYDSTLLGCMEDGAWQHIICTSKGLNDIYRELGNIKSNDWHISDDCNGRFSIKFFLMKKASIRPESWEMEFQLNPLPLSSRYFLWDHIEFIDGMTEFMEMFDSKTALQNVKFIGAMDMAVGKSTTAHYTALVVMAYYKGKYYLLQSYMKQGSSKIDKANMIAHAKRDFPFMNIVYIEADLTQSDYIDDLKEHIDCGVQIEEHYSRQEENKIKRGIDIGDLIPKHARIVAQMDEVIETRNFIVNRKMRNFVEFERQIKEFPQCKFDDLIDAVGSGMSQLKKRRYLLFGFSGA